MDRYHVFSTDDMVHWKDHGEILNASQVPWGRKEGGFMWAPDCAYKNGTYYFYFPHPSGTYTNDTWKIGVATSKEPAANFTVQGYIEGMDPLIDPHVFVDDDGQAYIYNGGGGVCKGGKLKDNMMELDGEMQVMEGLEDFHEAAWVHKYNGKYYFTATCPLYDRIELSSADTVNGIATAPVRTVWKKHETGALASHIWAPELHYVMGKWIIYFSAGHVPDVWDIRPYALICKGDDPMTDDWGEAVPIEPAANDPYPFTDFSLDMTVLENKGRWYAIWAQKFGCARAEKPISDLLIAELETPTKLKTVFVRITSPDYDWERDGGFWVNEGPAVLHCPETKGKIYVTYSASATGACYCLGMLSADENSDLLDPRSWEKERWPVLKTDAALKVYGPGHNTFVRGDDDEVLTLLHFRDYEKIVGDPLDDHNRHAHVLKVGFDANGKPVFKLNPAELYNTPYENEKQKGIND